MKRIGRGALLLAVLFSVVLATEGLSRFPDGPCTADCSCDRQQAVATQSTAATPTLAPPRDPTLPPLEPRCLAEPRGQVVLLKVEAEADAAR